jgi:hypothetical protein
MSVKITQPTNAKKRSDFWRRLYIRLLMEDIRSWDAMTSEDRALELGAIEDLVDAGYMVGSVVKDTSGIPQAATIRGPTLAGRIFAEEQQDILDRKSLWGRVKAGSTVFIGWLAGIISGFILWYFTRPK